MTYKKAPSLFKYILGLFLCLRQLYNVNSRKLNIQHKKDLIFQNWEMGSLTLHNEIICAVPIISGFDELTKNKFVKIGPYIFQKLDLTGFLFRKLAKIHNLYG